MRIFPRTPNMHACGRALCGFLGSLALLVPVNVRATTVIPPRFDELVATAEYVVEGEVTAVRAEMVDYQGRPLVYTYVTVEILDVIKGTPPEPLELRVLGGTVGDFSMRVEGVPEFRVGDRDILFIEGNGQQFCPLVAIMHGLYTIVPRPDDGKDIVLRTSGEPLARPADVQLPLAHGNDLASLTAASSVASAMTANEFKASIREEVRRAATQ